MIAISTILLQNTFMVIRTFYEQIYKKIFFWERAQFEYS